MVDVARCAGVAVGTVSNTLNHPAVVSARTKQKVLAAIEDLGFVRNEAARSLITGSSAIVGLIVVDLGEPFFVDLSRGVEEEIEQSGMHLLIAESGCRVEKQRAHIRVFEQMMAAGIVIAPVPHSDPRVSRDARARCPLEIVRDTGRHDITPGKSQSGEPEGRIAARRLMAQIRRHVG